VIFFTDRDLGAQIFPQILREAGIHVEPHDDHFTGAPKDEEWIPKIAARGWFVLTHNERIRYVTVEREAVLNSGVGMFVLVGKATTRELAHNFVNTYNQITAFADAHSRPFIARVYRPSPVTGVAQGVPGRVELWVPLPDQE
jgi:hypothetical protein